MFSYVFSTVSYFLVSLGSRTTTHSGTTSTRHRSQSRRHRDDRRMRAHLQKTRLGRDEQYRGDCSGLGVLVEGGTDRVASPALEASVEPNTEELEATGADPCTVVPLTIVALMRSFYDSTISDDSLFKTYCRA